jgi:hypothetical protein
MRKIYLMCQVKHVGRVGYEEVVSSCSWPRLTINMPPERDMSNWLPLLPEYMVELKGDVSVSPRSLSYTGI